MKTMTLLMTVLAAAWAAMGEPPGSSGIVLSTRKVTSLKDEIRERNAGTAEKPFMVLDSVRTYRLEVRVVNSTPARRDLALRVYHLRKTPRGELRVADLAERPCVLERNGSETLQVDATMNTEGDFAGYIVQALESNRLVAVSASVKGLEELGLDEAKLAAVKRDLRVKRAEKGRTGGV